MVLPAPSAQGSMSCCCMARRRCSAATEPRRPLMLPRASDLTWRPAPARAAIAVHQLGLGTQLVPQCTAAFTALPSRTCTACIASLPTCGSSPSTEQATSALLPPPQQQQQQQQGSSILQHALCMGLPQHGSGDLLLKQSEEALPHTGAVSHEPGSRLLQVPAHRHGQPCNAAQADHERRASSLCCSTSYGATHTNSRRSSDSSGSRSSRSSSTVGNRQGNLRAPSSHSRQHRASSQSVPGHRVQTEDSFPSLPAFLHQTSNQGGVEEGQEHEGQGQGQGREGQGPDDLTWAQRQLQQHRRRQRHGWLQRNVAYRSLTPEQQLQYDSFLSQLRQALPAATSTSPAHPPGGSVGCGSSVDSLSSTGSKPGSSTGSRPSSSRPTAGSNFHTTAGGRWGAASSADRQIGAVPAEPVGGARSAGSASGSIPRSDTTGGGSGSSRGSAAVVRTGGIGRRGGGAAPASVLSAGAAGRLGGCQAVAYLHSMALVGKADAALVTGILDAAAAAAAAAGPHTQRGRSPQRQQVAAGSRDRAARGPDGTASLDARGEWVLRLPSWAVVQLAWALATLRYPAAHHGHGYLLPCLYECTTPLFPRLGFSRATALAWALARLREGEGERGSGPPPPVQWWAALEAATQLPEREQWTGAVPAPVPPQGAPLEGGRHFEAGAVEGAAAWAGPHQPRGAHRHAADAQQQQTSLRQGSPSDLKVDAAPSGSRPSVQLVAARPVPVTATVVMGAQQFTLSSDGAQGRQRQQYWALGSGGRQEGLQERVQERLAVGGGDEQSDALQYSSAPASSGSSGSSSSSGSSGSGHGAALPRGEAGAGGRAAAQLTNAATPGDVRSLPSSAGQVALLIWAAGSLNPEPRPSVAWLRSLVSWFQYGTGRVESLASSERAMLLKGLARLGFRPPLGLWDPMIGRTSHAAGGKSGRVKRPGSPQAALHHRQQADSFSFLDPRWYPQGLHRGLTSAHPAVTPVGPAETDGPAGAAPCAPPSHSLPTPPHLWRPAMPPSPGRTALGASHGHARVGFNPRQPATGAPSGWGGPDHGPRGGRGGEEREGGRPLQGSALAAAAGDAGKGGSSGAPPAQTSVQGGDLQGMLWAASKLGGPLQPGCMEEAATKLQGRLWQLSPKQLLGAAQSLQQLGHTPSPSWQMAWLEECHTKLRRFSALQLVQLMQVMAAWRISPGRPWVTDLVAAATTQLHACSRSRLVELTCAMASLGVRLHLCGTPAPAGGGVQEPLASGRGVVQESESSVVASEGKVQVRGQAHGQGNGRGSSPMNVEGLPAAAMGARAVADGVRQQAKAEGSSLDAASSGSSHAEANQLGVHQHAAPTTAAEAMAAAGAAAAAAAAPAPGAGDDSAFLCAVLSCFLTRSAPQAGSRQAPLPRHIADLAVSLAQLCGVTLHAFPSSSGQPGAQARAEACEAGVATPPPAATATAQCGAGGLKGSGSGRDSGVALPSEVEVLLRQVFGEDDVARTWRRLAPERSAAVMVALERLGVQVQLGGAEPA